MNLCWIPLQYPIKLLFYGWLIFISFSYWLGLLISIYSSNNTFSHLSYNLAKTTILPGSMRKFEHKHHWLSQDRAIGALLRPHVQPHVGPTFLESYHTITCSNLRSSRESNIYNWKNHFPPPAEVWSPTSFFWPKCGASGFLFCLSTDDWIRILPLCLLAFFLLMYAS